MSARSAVHATLFAARAAMQHVRFQDLTPFLSFSRRAVRARCSAGLGADEFIQTFDDLSQFFKAHFAESLTDPFNRQRANLADLDP